jgi:hypothetical protein
LPNPHSKAYYAEDVAKFIATPTETILGIIASNTAFAVDPLQRDAWLTQIDILKLALGGVTGTVFFEFVVPRIGSRIDSVLLSGSAIFAMEFKVGETEFKRQDLNQVWDYALDLKNFHKASHKATIIPILVATRARSYDSSLRDLHADGVWAPVRSNESGLSKIIKLGIECTNGEFIDGRAWLDSSYQPTPTIIEAAQALYAQHSVEAIARHDAGARNLGITSGRIEELVTEASENQRKKIVFVTGVPGAGKTLVGLNVATRKRDQSSTHAVFLSGNGPLVAVLREALTRDEMSRLRRQKTKARKGDITQKVKAFIQNVHHFRDEAVREVSAPHDHVVIFDEAQRAWDKETTSSFMLRRKKVTGFDMSEPEFLISYLDRHDDWAVIVCLVGGGQEIHRGEAGISAWLDAVNHSFPSWEVYVSSELTDSEYAAGHALDMLNTRSNVVKDSCLHLSVAMRSFRAERVSSFVKALLDCDRDGARKILEPMTTKYPIVLTRDLNVAKDWVRSHARGSERYGLVASSSAQRLKPHAIDVRVAVDPIHWFLNDSGDTRSSFYLEDAATEFQVQGLELDWVCVTWDADLRFGRSDWGYNSFVGSRWTSIKKPERQQYLRNAYRVLLTRARQGMVIFVPKGDIADATRTPAYYDSTFEYLASVGIPVLAS